MSKYENIVASSQSSTTADIKWKNKLTNVKDKRDFRTVESKLAQQLTWIGSEVEVATVSAENVRVDPRNYIGLLHQIVHHIYTFSQLILQSKKKTKHQSVG